MSLFSRGSSRGPDRQGSGKERRALDTSWKKWGSEWSDLGKREGKKKEKRGGEPRSEVESRVIKIHPTVQTKGGMKKGENAGESESWGVGGGILGRTSSFNLRVIPDSPPPASE